MKILLANYRYFVSGGPERYLFEAQRALEARGHEVIPFSIRYARNEPTPYEKYFVPPLAGTEAVKFDEHRWTPASFLKTLERAFYSPEVERAVGRLVEDTRPDVAYVLHYLKKLSPSLLVGLRKRGIPIVVRVSDFLMLCPQALFLRDGKPCTLCARGTLWPSVRYRCVKGSLAASAIHYASTRYHRFRRYFDLVDRWVIPSEFTMDQLKAAGWPPERLVHLPTFVSPLFLAAPPAADKRARPYLLFVGHFEPHKGPDLLLRAYAAATPRAAGAPPRLLMVGSLDQPFAKTCRRLAQELGVGSLVEFRDFAPAETLRSLYSGALATIMPSICFENMPNVLLESYACGTPVIGSDHGSIRELIREGQTGRRVRPNDADALEAALTNLLARPEDYIRMGPAAREMAARAFDVDRHAQRLVSLFDDVIRSRPRDAGGRTGPEERAAGTDLFR